MTAPRPPGAVPGAIPPTPPAEPSGPFAGRGRILAAVGAVVVLLAGFTLGMVVAGGDDDADTATAGTSSTTTTATSTTSSTDASTSSTIAARNDGPVPVVLAGGYALGFWDGTTWQDLTGEEGGPLPPLPDIDGVPYQWIGIDEVVRSSLPEVGEGCYLGTSHGVFTDLTMSRVGVPIGLDALPRPVEVITPATAHESDVEAWLRSQGIDDPVVVIDRVTQVDLDGDGDLEVFIEAANDDADFSGDAGGYSVLLYRYVDGAGEARTVVLGGDVVDEDEVDTELGVAFTYELVGIADLNEDGEFEVVSRGSFYEGEAVTMSNLRGARVLDRLSTGCGA